MSAVHWNSMRSAPKDGTVILLIYQDATGVVPAFWGIDAERKRGWIAVDEGMASEKRLWLCTFRGWISAPQTAEWEVLAGSQRRATP